MLDTHGFDLWAEGYDKSVNAADEDNAYPFAGYKSIMNAIYGAVMQKSPAKVLDIGVGTGVLAAKLYAGGNPITAIDFSEKMLKLAAAKMPDATFIQHDFTKGLPAEVTAAKFDFIISTYALHHLPDDLRAALLTGLAPYLAPQGTVLVGDSTFQTQAQWEACQAAYPDDWDEDEYFAVMDTFVPRLAGVYDGQYRQISHCGGILALRPKGEPPC